MANSDDSSRSEIRSQALATVLVTIAVTIISIVLSALTGLAKWYHVLAGAILVGAVFIACLFVVTSIVASGLDRRIAALIERFITNQFSARSDWLITTNELQKIEAGTTAEHIWIITSSLEEEVDEAAFGDVIRNNLKRGKSYTYFIPNTLHLRARVSRMRDMYKSEKMHFKVIDADLFKIISAQDMAIFGATGSGAGRMAGYMNLPVKEGGNDFFIVMGTDHCDRIVGILSSVDSKDL